MGRTVFLHSDLNCFYAAVEMMLAPQLKGKAAAYNITGDLYYYGKNAKIPSDLKKALSCFLASANLGDPYGIWSAAYMMKTKPAAPLFPTMRLWQMRKCFLRSIWNIGLA